MNQQARILLRRSMFSIATVSATLFLSGCEHLFYSKVSVGKFEGRLHVEWVGPNEFVFRPDEDKPLAYTTASGRRIQPELMYTDGGSIPRLFWSSKGLGPWDFAPGYLVHDWLFHQHHCQLGNWHYTTPLLKN